jgi:DHA1 family multidrug resistance protein-like MFS transporter
MQIRGVAIAIFSATVIAGPLTGPMIGGFITKSHLGWRFTAWIPSFMGYASAVAALFFQTETYGPVILVSKASELRRLTRNWGIHAKQEEVEVDIKELAVKNISRPMRILFTEPIVLVITTYMSFLYGLLYLNLTAYAIVYEEIYLFSLGVAGIPYMAMIIGVMIGLATVIFMNKDYVKKLEANNNIPVPEWRMILPMPGGIIFAAGLFWFGWAGYKPDVSYWASIVAGLFIGFGIYTVFLQCLNYIIGKL